nr:hypothetical protein [Yersinia wautersii]
MQFSRLFAEGRGPVRVFKGVVLQLHHRRAHISPLNSQLIPDSEDPRTIKQQNQQQQAQPSEIKLRFLTRMIAT